MANRIRNEVKRVLQGIRKGRFVAFFLFDGMIANQKIKAARARQRAAPALSVWSRSCFIGS